MYTSAHAKQEGPRLSKQAPTCCSLSLGISGVFPMKDDVSTRGQVLQAIQPVGDADRRLVGPRPAALDAVPGGPGGAPARHQRRIRVQVHRILRIGERSQDSAHRLRLEAPQAQPHACAGVLRLSSIRARPTQLALPAAYAILDREFAACVCVV